MTFEETTTISMNSGTGNQKPSGNHQEKRTFHFYRSSFADFHGHHKYARRLNDYLCRPDTGHRGLNTTCHGQEDDEHHDTGIDNNFNSDAFLYEHVDEELPSANRSSFFTDKYRDMDVSIDSINDTHGLYTHFMTNMQSYLSWETFIGYATIVG